MGRSDSSRALRSRAPPRRSARGAQMTLSMAVAGNARASLSRRLAERHLRSRPAPRRCATTTSPPPTPAAARCTAGSRSAATPCCVHVDTAGRALPAHDRSADRAQRTAHRRRRAGRGPLRLQRGACLRDGDTALVGAPRDDGFAGAAWVFVRSGSTWAQQGEADGRRSWTEFGEEQCSEPEEPAKNPASECGFGASVALSADGDTALVGAPQRSNAEGRRMGVHASGLDLEQTGEAHERPKSAGKGRFGRASRSPRTATTR